MRRKKIKENLKKSVNIPDLDNTANVFLHEIITFL